MRLRKKRLKLPPGTAWGYGRGSTEEQEETLVHQRGEIAREYERRLKHKGYALGDTFIDEGVSSSVPLMQRPQGYRLCLALGRGDAVIVTDLDRIFRNTHELCRHLEEWDERGVRLVVLSLDIDTGTPVGRAAIQMLAVFGEFEKSMTSERLRDWWASRRARGLPAGGRYPPYGFRRVGGKSSRRYEPWPEQRALGARIVQMMDGGYTLDQVYGHLAALGCENPNTGALIGRAAVWRYYVWEKRALAVEAAPAGGTGPEPGSVPPVAAAENREGRADAGGGAP